MDSVDLDVLRTSTRWLAAGRRVPSAACARAACMSGGAAARPGRSTASAIQRAWRRTSPRRCCKAASQLIVTRSP